MKLIQNLLLLIVMSTFFIDAQAQHPLKDWQFEVGAPADQAREHWRQLTAGEELAHGKKVDFFPKPNDALTTDVNDPYDLTDGKLSTRLDDRIWFNKDAVGWYGGLGTSGGILLLIDLGAEQPIGQIAIRVLGGREQGSLDLPATAEFLASKDGRQYYSLQNMVKLNPAEKEQSDFVTGFYYPEEGKAYMAPLVCEVPVRARYVALRITPQTSLFTNQISILKAPASAILKELESYPPARVYMDGLAVSPRHNPLTVTTNIVTPNWLRILDNSGLNLEKEPARIRLELPQGLRVLPLAGVDFKETIAGRHDTNIYEFNYNGRNSQGIIGPVWIKQEENIPIPADAKAKLTGILQGRDSHTIVSPLKVVSIPEVPELKDLDVSVAWMLEAQQMAWPNFLTDFRKMGFNYVSTFPYYFRKDSKGQWNENTRKMLDFLQQARRQGYRIVSNESTFHEMWKVVVADQQAGKIDEAHAYELYNQVNGKRGQHMNILYRGKYYQDEIKRVAELTALVQPDHLYFDIEWWDRVVAESKQDPRVITVWKQSGKEWNEFVTDIGTEIFSDLVTTMRDALGEKKITVGLYNSDPQNKIYNSIFHWDKIYPGLVDIAMPSLYVQGRASIVAERIRFDYNAMQSRTIIPWLSAGTYGEFDPKWMEPMVLETILNGSRGMTYYRFTDFDPLDFYYHSKALVTLAPFKDLLKTGKPVPYKGDNPNLHYTAFASEKEFLLLIGNYGGSPKTKATLPLVFGGQTKMTLVGENALNLKDNQTTIEIPPHQFRLIHLENSQN